MKKIILIIMAVLIFSGIGYAQVSNLTERELLIQLNEKMIKNSEGIIRIETNLGLFTNRLDIVDNRINIVETRMTVTEGNINSLIKQIAGLTGTWNWLLGIFGVFLVSITIYIWKGIYEKNRKTDNTNN